MDSAFVRGLPSQLSHLLFQRWVPDSAIAYSECGEAVGDGYEMQALWGVARVALVEFHEDLPDSAVGRPDSLWRHASATLEVTRVLSQEWDPASSDGFNFTRERLVVRPSLDTVTLDWDRRDDGWHRCGPVWLAHSAVPIVIVGPDAEARQERGAAPTPLPADASWSRARTLADSIGRAGPAVVIRLSPHGPPRRTAVSMPDSAP